MAAHLHQNPELSLHEQDTARFVQETLEPLASDRHEGHSLTRAHIDPPGRVDLRLREAVTAHPDSGYRSRVGVAR